MDDKAKTMLLKAHQLASEKGMPFFANLLENDQKYSVFSSSGFRLTTDLNGDWEIDTLRTGCFGYVAINMPRVAYESGKDKKKFFEILMERFEMATRALEIKDKALKQHGKGLLPFLMQTVNGDYYFRLENCSRIINLVGLKEAVEAFYEKGICDSEKYLEFVQGIVQNVQASKHRIGRKRGKLFLAMQPDFEASERLAQLDIERYGIGKIRFSGTREKPFYSTVNKLTFQDGKVSPESLAFEQKMRSLHMGGNLTVIELEEAEHKPDALMSFTKQAFDTYNIGFLAYNRKMTYCINCKRSWFGLLHKCPSCGAISTLIYFNQN
jgi:ribonucleoside-triphosphate reductase